MKKVIKPLLCVLFAVLIISQILFGIAIIQLDMLPNNFVIPLFILMALCTGLVGILLYAAVRKCSKTQWGLQTVSALVCLVGIVVFLLGHSALVQARNTISNITNEPILSAIVNLYVRADDPAQTIDDTAAYTFGITESYDWENTTKAIAGIEEHLGVKLQTVNYPTVFAMVDGLYAQEVDAIFLNEAYLDILTELDAYADFETRTRNVYEYAITETVPPTEDSPNPTKPGGDQIGDYDEVKPFIMYLGGSDSRKYMLRTSRNDVNILIVVNPQTKQILMVNTPRDSFVPNTAGSGALDKLTHCGLYGVNCSISTLENLYGITVDYYSRINFTGFETLIDAIGGVTIQSDIAFTTTHGGHKIVKGENHLNGAQALGYARERYKLPGGERERGKNQMKLITAAIKKMLSGSLFTNYTEILASMEDLFVTTFPQEDISALIKMQLTDMSDWNILSYATNGTPSYDYTYSMPGVELYVLKLNDKYVSQAADLMQRVLDGEILTADDLK